MLYQKSNLTVQAIGSDKLLPILFGFSVLCLEFLMYFIFPLRPIEMSFAIAPIFVWILTGMLVNGIKQPLNRLYVYVSLVLYLFGNTNAVASYFYYGQHYYTDLQQANLIYSSLVTLFVLGLYLGEKLLGIQKIKTIELTVQESKSSVFYIGSFIFPFVWIVDQYLALGYIPIFSGTSIIEDMYAITYGHLYGYGILLGVSALLVWTKFLSSDTYFIKLVLLLSLLFMVFVMVFDGRRIFLLTFLGGMLAYELVRGSGEKSGKKILVFSLVIVILYVFILFLRQGGEVINEFTPHDVFSKMGVEYRDFAYVVTHVEPGSLYNYSWFLSGIGGFFNQFLLAIVGVDKNMLIFSGSAYQLALSVFNSSFGIRIGLFPELWLEFGLYSYLVIVIIGIFFVFITSLVLKSRHELSLIIACMFYGVTVLSFVGQTSAITGYYSLLIYLWLLWWFLNEFKFKNDRPV